MSARWRLVLGIVVCGALGTAMIVHANRVHYGDQAWTVAIGVGLVWLALALAAVRP